MRPIICDVCGKMMKKETAFDEDGHTTDDGYVNIEFRESRDHYGEYDICINCYNKILKYADNLKPQKETSFKEYLDEQMKDPEFKKEYDKLEKESKEKYYITERFKMELRDAIYRNGEPACVISKKLGLPSDCITKIINGHTKKMTKERHDWICVALYISPEV